MNSIKPFLFESEFLVRVAESTTGEPLFVAADACRILGIKNVSQAVESLDSDEKGISTIPTNGGVQTVIGVTESGLYDFIFRSRKPAAIRFRKWVTSEVLPTLRKTGSYSTGADGQREHLGVQQAKVRVAAANAAMRFTGQLRKIFGPTEAAKLAPEVYAYLGVPYPTAAPKQGDLPFSADGDTQH